MKQGISKAEKQAEGEREEESERDTYFVFYRSH
jgi:hypothetical protein